MKRLFLLTFLGILSLAADAAPRIEGCPLQPADNVWNAPVDQLPRHPQSDAYVATIGATRGVHPDFGTVYEGAPIGIPYVSVPGNQPRVAVSFEFDDESDPGPYPIPPNPPIEGGPQSSGDRHVLMLDRDNCRLYELYAAYPNANGTWRAGSGAIYDLNSNALRPSGWTSADAAGLPILPGLVRFDEVAAGEITHAIRFTAPQTQRAFLWPARHFASSRTGAEFPPMGLRMRLKASVNIASYSPQVQVILRGLKKYGMILADNGSAWYLSGVPDSRWNDDILVGELRQIKGSDFEAVDVSSLMISSESGAARSTPSTPTASAAADWTVTEYYNTILQHYFITATDGERASIDSGGAGPGWQRTGTASYKVWSAPGTDLSPVCRFYGNPAIGANGRRIGPNSHFYTIEPGECEFVKRDPGWIYEGIVLHARRLSGAGCPAGLKPLIRVYNNGFPTRDANHRYTTDPAIAESMRPLGWTVEGPQMCVN